MASAKRKWMFSKNYYREICFADSYFKTMILGGLHGVL
jgi:hypothetical protein